MRYLKAAFKTTFSERRHVVVAATGFLLIVLAALWVGSASTIGFILKASVFTPGAKAALVAKTLFGGFAVFKTASFVMTLVIAALFGVNLAMTAHYFRCKARLDAAAGTGALGALIGMLGVGCAACGSVVLSTILGTGVVAGLVRILPFDGIEFGLIGAVVLLLSIRLVAKNISDPVICRIPEK